jgi:hypothetical protein
MIFVVNIAISMLLHAQLTAVHHFQNIERYISIT